MPNVICGYPLFNLRLYYVGKITTISTYSFIAVVPSRLTRLVCCYQCPALLRANPGFGGFFKALRVKTPRP